MKAKHDVLFLLLVAGLIFVLNIWAYPLFDVDEPRYAETAREMILHGGDWITPHFNWHIRFDKPPMFYWLIASSYLIFGVSAFSARLISALASFGIMLMLYFICRKTWDRKMGLLAALIFATMLEIFFLGRTSITDMTLACFMTGAWLSLYAAQAYSPKWFLAAGAFAGLGLLTKGPVALVLPGATLMVFLAISHRHQWRLLISPWLFWGLALMFAIALPWYVAVTLANPDTFIQSFFFLHNLQRFGGVVSGHQGPWYYYIPTLLLGAFPWTLLLPYLVQRIVNERRTLPNLVIYSLAWFILVFLFFSLAKTKLITYILPGFVPLAILMAWFWKPALESQAGEKPPNFETLRGLSIALTALALSGVVFVFGFAARLIPDNLQSLYHHQPAQLVILLLSSSFGIAAYFAWHNKALRVFQTLLTGVVLAYITTNLLVFPMVGHMLQADILPYALKAKQDDIKMGTYNLTKPSLVFYQQKQVVYTPKLHEEDQLTEFLNTNPPFERLMYLVVRKSEVEELNRIYPLELVNSGYVYSLVRVRNFPIDKDSNQ